ncbi:hypothetical protein MAL1_00138 [Bacteriophage DSS3_MAL1]|nr:hypothetical protein MAL1_00138 [Bacteriophage DSS3_MAL1]
MTTIAYRNGVMAADTLMARGNERAVGAVKIFATKKFLVGISGAFSNLEPLKAFLSEHEEEVSDPGELWRFWEDAPEYGGGYCCLIVTKDGDIWNAIDSPPVRIPAEFDAIGSGGTYAMGAMGAGATACDAVRVARQFDVNTGGSVIRLTLDDIKGDEK